MNRDHLFAVATARKRNSQHWTNSAVTWGEILDWMKTPVRVKESGNYLMGTLRPTTRQHNPEDKPCTKLHRTKDAVVTRSALTLDLDSPRPGLAEVLPLVLDHAALLHTTFSSTPDLPRYRLIIPLDREIRPDEYVAAAQVVMNLLGTDNFDPGSEQPERYMFKPACANELENFQWWVLDGEPAIADKLLAGWDSDLSKTPIPESPKGKRDPFEIEGVVGAFNRAYEDWQVLIEEYDLPYTPAGADRWHLAGAVSVAGMGVMGPGLVYSHHAHDPAYGQACSAFDLVRLHLFGELDEDLRKQTPLNRRPSYEAMLDVARIDARAVSELVGADFSANMDDLNNANQWRTGLRYNRNGTKMLDEVGNWDLISQNDPVCRHVGINEMTLSIETNADLPWRKLHPGGPAIRMSDRASFQMYLEREYRLRPTRSISDWMIDEQATRAIHNPVRQWLENLEWDGVPRVEECLPGVTPTEYTRMVARKSLVAAVARMMEPGCKWDHTLILFGNEGLGKTWWIERMSRGWTAPLGPVGHKDTLINLQRCWIATSDEGASMRKADAEALKEFLTRRVDVFRLPYEREATAHPRHCVIWGTTNDDVFLRNQEGNRRFLIVRCEQAVDFSLMTPEYVAQVWAEAVYLYRMGEVLLWLDSDESVMAAGEREAFVEEGNGALEGLIAAYLDTPLPGNWDSLSMESRQMWLRDQADGMASDGDFQQEVVCTIQLYVEALGRLFGTHNRLDLLEIGKALRAQGWQPQPGRLRMGPYGPQQVYRRPPENPLKDLL